MSTFEQKLFGALYPQRKPVRKHRRGQRRGPMRSEPFRRWIAAQPCLICGSSDVQAAHTKNNGMRSKGPDFSCVPLCLAHHPEYDAGRRAFCEKYGIEDMAQIAANYFAEWNERGAAGELEDRQPAVRLAMEGGDGDCSF